MKIKSENVDFYNVEELRRTIRLTPQQKLKHLESLNHFLSIAMPPQSKAIWEQLRKRGW